MIYKSELIMLSSN